MIIHNSNGWMKEVTLDCEIDRSDIDRLLEECGHVYIASFYQRTVQEDGSEFDVYFIFHK